MDDFAKIKVSVIVPIYNTEKYVVECLESIVNQTLKEIEIICIDDGSTDNSIEIVKCYSNIKIIHQKHSGLSIARNTGMQNANGEYIYFCDSDDILVTNALEELYNYSKKNNLDMLCFDGNTFYDQESLKNKFPYYQNYYKRHYNYDISTGRNMFGKMITNNEFRTACPLYLFKREFLHKNNITFFEKILYEDLLFTTQCFLIADKVGYISKQLYNRRIRDNSIVTSSENVYRKLQSYRIIYCELLKFLKEEGIEDESTRILKQTIIANILELEKTVI